MLKHNENGLIVTWKADPENPLIYTSLKKVTDAYPQFKYNTLTKAESWRKGKRYETDAVLIQKVAVV